jgi:hypothetical protein
MSRNPYAKSLRTKPQQVIPDKREKTLREIYDETLKEDCSEFERLIAGLK